MTLPIWKTDCGCEQVVAMGAKRERFCGHGRPYVKVRPEDEEGPVPRRRSFGTGSKEPRRDWADARAKVDDEGSCRICKKAASPAVPLEAARVFDCLYLLLDRQVVDEVDSVVVDVSVAAFWEGSAEGEYPVGVDVELLEDLACGLVDLGFVVLAAEDAGGIAPAWVKLAPVGPDIPLPATPNSKGPQAAPEGAV